MKKWDVFVYGDINVDLILPGVEQIPPKGEEWDIPKIWTLPGGGAALFVLGIGKLGMHPVFQGSVGEDCYGNYLLEALKKCNVDTSLLKIKEGEETGVSLSFTGKTDRSFLTYRGTNESLDINRVKLEDVKQARHIHVTGYAGSKNHDIYKKFLSEVSALEDVSISLDVGWDDSGEWNSGIYELLPFLDVLFMNETECLHYSKKETPKEAALDFAAHCKNAVIKLGKKGALLASKGSIIEKQGYQVTAVDTTGAGDSFNAGFIYAFLNGYSQEKSLACGNGCGALSCTGYGGNTAFPDLTQLMEMITES